MTPRSHDGDLAIARLSRKQFGAWSRRQALRLMTPKVIEGRLRTGEWLGLDHGVYGHVAVPPTWERSLMAAVLAEVRADISHRAGAALHELEGFRRGRPEITVPPGASSRSRLAIVHRGVDVRTTTIRGIPVVTLEQVFIDLAQVCSERKLRVALAERSDRVPRLLDAVRDRFCALAPRGGRDLRPLRRVLEQFGAGDLPTRSELEVRLAEVLATPGIPPVLWQAPFPGRVASLERVDGLITPWALVVEADGRAWHTRIEDFERDRRRDAEAAAAGHLTLRFTHHQLTYEAAWVRRVVIATGSTRAATRRAA